MRDRARERLVLRDPGAVGFDKLVFSPDGSMLASSSATARVSGRSLSTIYLDRPPQVTRSLSDEECRRYLHVAACPTMSVRGRVRCRSPRNACSPCHRSSSRPTTSRSRRTNGRDVPLVDHALEVSAPVGIRLGRPVADEPVAGDVGVLERVEVCARTSAGRSCCSVRRGHDRPAVERRVARVAVDPPVLRECLRMERGRERRRA